MPGAAKRTGDAPPRNKTERLLRSFQSVELLPEHRNGGNQGPYLRDFGFAPGVVSKLIRWGETEGLVCTFENAGGVSPGSFHWEAAFLVAACKKHRALFGDADLTRDFIDWVEAQCTEAGRSNGRQNS